MTGIAGIKQWKPAMPVAAAALLLAAPTGTRSQGTSWVVIGDSLSAEYDSLSGIAGVDDPTEYAAVTVPGWESRCWVEVLGALRPDAINLGGYGTDILEWGALRFSGYEYNFAVPGFTAAQFEQVVNSSLFSDPQLLPYKQQLQQVIQNDAGAAVVWLGANEFRANYGFLYDGNDPSSLVNDVQDDLADVLDFVLAENPGIQLVVVNLPDLGATPDKQDAHPDPAKRANVTAATILANEAIEELAVARGIPVADAFTDTAKLIAGEDLWIGPIRLLPGTHPDNHPQYRFTRDGLHPNTCLQALIAREIVDTFNAFHQTGIPALTDGEILDLIGIDPRQPFLDWTSTNQLGTIDPGENTDGDQLPAIAEFLFNGDPNASDPLPATLGVGSDELTLSYRPDADRSRLVEAIPHWSIDLSNWQPVPEQYISQDSTGTVTVTVPMTAEQRFLRIALQFRNFQ